MPNHVHIFISCVSDEFGNYRDAIRRDLSRPNLDTKVQEDFIAYGGATLEKLDDYIQHCDAVIHIVGDMTGSMANELSLRYINNKYPDLGTRFPQLKPVLEGETGLSYTQWEAYLAAYHNKRLFVAAPTENTARSDRYKSDAAQAEFQKTHLNNLRALGYYDEIKFTTEDELVKKLYQSKLGDILNALPKIKPVNLPYKSIGNNFKGREAVLNDLHEMFLTGWGDGIAIAVHGLGGMGKTRLAVEYAWKYENNYTALLFITAASPELLKSNIANLSSTLMLDLLSEEANKEDAKYAAVINWLNQYAGWLMVIDNVDTREAAKKVEEFFAQLQRGHVLITTRVDKWSIQVKKIQLDVLAEDDAAAFLLQTTAEREKIPKDNELAYSIANDLGRLALALEQARAYIVTKELSFEKYRKKWEKSRLDVLSWFDEQLMQYPQSVAITWQTSFNQLSAGATTLLNRLAWLAPDPIPRTLLDVEWTDDKKIDAEVAWEELKQYSLATSTEDKKAFIIHKLVQDVTLGRMDEQVKSITLNETLHWIQNAAKGDANIVSQFEPLVPHILRLIDHADLRGISMPTNRLISIVASIFYLKAQYEQAEPLMRRALALDEQNLGYDHPQVATDLNDLGQLLYATNRLQDAELLMRKALEIDEQYFGSNHPHVAIRLSNLALLLHETNRTQEAETLLRRTLEIDKQHYDPDDPAIARDLNNLALLLSGTNRLQEAETLTRKALDINERKLGLNHPWVAKSLNNLARILSDTNQLQEAEPLIRRALEIDEQNFGLNHPTVALDLNTLSQILQNANRLEEAEPLLRRSLQIHQQALGVNHPSVGICLNNLGELLRRMGRSREVELLFRKALEIAEQSFGYDHPHVAIYLSNLAHFLQSVSRTEEAEPLIRRALEIDERSLGSNHPRVAIRLNNLAQVCVGTNRFEEAEPLLKRALIIFYRSFGLNHPNTKTIGDNYELLLEHMGHSKEAIANIISTLFSDG